MRWIAIFISQFPKSIKWRGGAISTIATASPGVYTWIVSRSPELGWPMISAWPISICVAALCIAVLVAIRATTLEKRLEPRIKMDGPFIWTMPKNATEQALRTYRVRMTNISSEVLRGCRVRLVEMRNVNGEPSKEHGRHFRLSTDDPPDILNTPHTQTFDIPPKDYVDIDIAQLDERTPNSKPGECKES